MNDPVVPIPKVPAPVTFLEVLTLDGTLVLSNLLPDISITFTARETATVNSIRPVTKAASQFVETVVYSLSNLTVVMSGCWKILRGSF